MRSPSTTSGTSSGTTSSRCSNDADPVLEAVRLAVGPLGERDVDHLEQLPVVLARAEVAEGEPLGQRRRRRAARRRGRCAAPTPCGPPRSRASGTARRRRCAGPTRSGRPWLGRRRGRRATSRAASPTPMPRPRCAGATSTSARPMNTSPVAASSSPCQTDADIVDEIEVGPVPVGGDVAHGDVDAAAVVQLALGDEAEGGLEVVAARRAAPCTRREARSSCMDAQGTVHPGHRAGETGPGGGSGDSSRRRTSSKSRQATYGTPSRSQCATRASLANVTSA